MEDWDHANAIIYDEASDSYYISLRNQDAIIKVNRTDETLTWILGTPANWELPWQDKLLEPAGDLLWPFHQHAVQLTPQGICLFDNGTDHRAAAYEPYDDEQPQWSRAVMYAIDEAQQEVSEIWSYGDPAGDNFYFSYGFGDADWQPVTGNVLITNGDTWEAGNIISGQIMEVTPEGERVFDLIVRSSEPDSVNAVYRAERIADIRQ